MTECRRCERKAQLFICNTCIDGLRKQLRELPWWLDRLAETAIGQARLSDGGRRATRRDVLHGDDTLASHIEPLRACRCDEDEACECNVDKARKRRQRDALAHILAVGRVNARASTEYDRIQSVLVSWIREVCENRGVELPRLNTASAMALWLAKHAHEVAGQEDADRCCDEIADATKAIERIVNRPMPPRFIGPCPGEAPERVLAERREMGDHTTRCNHELTAPHNAKSVTCPQCSAVHGDVEEVIAQNFEESSDALVTVRELVDWVLPRLNKPVPQRTLEDWINREWVPDRGRNSAGARMVRLGDVLDQRAKLPRFKNAG